MEAGEEDVGGVDLLAEDAEALDVDADGDGEALYSFEDFGEHLEEEVDALVHGTEVTLAGGAVGGLGAEDPVLHLRRRERGREAEECERG